MENFVGPATTQNLVMVKFAVDFWWKMLLTIFPSKRSSKIIFQTSAEVRHQFRRKLRQLHSGNRWCLTLRSAIFEFKRRQCPKLQRMDPIIQVNTGLSSKDAKSENSNDCPILDMSENFCAPEGKSRGVEHLHFCSVRIEIFRRSYSRAMLKGTNLRGQMPICGFLQVPAVLSGFLRKSAFPKCFVF